MKLRRTDVKFTEICKRLQGYPRVSMVCTWFVYSFFCLLLASSAPFSSTPVLSTPTIVCQYFYVSHCQYFMVLVSGVQNKSNTLN